jgi:hypothetical protein
MALSFDSPRASLRTADFKDIDNSLANVGHVVLDDVWNTRFLSDLCVAADRKFCADDARFKGRYEEFSEGEIDQYLGNHAALESLDAASDEEFFEEFERTGLPAMMRRLFSGSFVLGRSERVVRRTDPQFPIRFTGLHADGQLGFCSSRGLRSKRELTLWTPLLNCTDDVTPRLLLLHRGETFNGLFDDEKVLSENNVEHLPIQLRPHQTRNESNQIEVAQKVHNQFDRLFEVRRCYAPKLPLGSAILFEHSTVHGSYTRPSMSTARYSFDCRFVGEYKRTDENAVFSGKLFGMQEFPPKPQPGFARTIRRALRFSPYK